MNIYIRLYIISLSVTTGLLLIWSLNYMFDRYYFAVKMEELHNRYLIEREKEFDESIRPTTTLCQGRDAAFEVYFHERV